MIPDMRTAKETIHAFAEAICNGDIHSAGSLLCEKGNFEIQHSDLEIVSAVKTQFISWLALRRLEYPKRDELSFTITSCIDCKMNHGVVAFNEGHFPFMAWLSYRLSFAGIAVTVQDGLITSTHICFAVPHGKNPSFLSRFIDEINEMERTQGIDHFSASTVIFEREYGRAFKIEDVQ